MSAYLVGFTDIRHEEVFQKEYVEKALPILEKHNAKVLCIAPSGNAKEGIFPPGEIVIIEFPNMSDAEAFYTDPEYQPLIKFRQTICDSQLGLFQGIE